MNPYFRVSTVWLRVDAISAVMLGFSDPGETEPVLRIFCNHDPEAIELFGADALAAWEHLSSLAQNVTPDDPALPALLRTGGETP